MDGLQIKITVGLLPSDYTCDGDNRSPKIDVGGVNTAQQNDLQGHVTQYCEAYVTY